MPPRSPSPSSPRLEICTGSGGMFFPLGGRGFAVKASDFHDSENATNSNPFRERFPESTPVRTVRKPLRFDGGGHWHCWAQSRMWLTSPPPRLSHTPASFVLRVLGDPSRSSVRPGACVTKMTCTGMVQRISAFQMGTRRTLDGWEPGHLSLKVLQIKGATRNITLALLSPWG